MVNTARQTKRVRQRERAEARAAARHKAEQRRRLEVVLGGLATVALVVLAVLALTGGGDDGAGPSTTQRVTGGGPPRTEQLAIGEVVPGFSAPGLDGGVVAWSGYTGAPAVLSVWAPWCPHCQVELPILDDVMREFPLWGS
jgi:thiol-disulfide isomerase/thioredoxin